MRSYYDIVKELKSKYPETSFTQCPPKVVNFYFYYRGQLVHKTNRLDDPAIDKKWTKECVVENQEEIDNYWNKLKEVEHESIQLLKDEVKQTECSDISQELFELCWNKSYEEYHFSGFDNVAINVSDFVDFALEVIALYKEDNK